jgi:hypothetical protein
MGVQSKDQIAAHPLRGAMFENMVNLEALKYRFNRGLRRESTGVKREAARKPWPQSPHRNSGRFALHRQANGSTHSRVMTPFALDWARSKVISLPAEVSATANQRYFPGANLIGDELPQLISRDRV